MKRSWISRTSWAAALPALGLALACSGSGSTPTQPPTGGGTPTPAPTPTVQPTPLPSPSAASCPIGKGDIDARCGRSGPRLLPDVEAAIDRLVKERPELFNLREELSPGAYRVLNAPEYLLGVAGQLVAAGFCAELLGDQVLVKNSQEFSEEYDILTASGFIRRGSGSYVKFCSPASFPLTAEDLIHRVFVFPVGLSCPEGHAEPPAIERKEIPVGCMMIVTATPKDRNLDDVDPRIHGPEIKWDVPLGDYRIWVDDYPQVAFNKRVTGLEPGEFAICAEVKKVAGCLNAKVIP